MVTGSEKLLSSVNSGSNNLGDNNKSTMSSHLNNEDLQSTLASELEQLLILQRNHGLFIERERDFNISRSGSAPPTVEGALNAAGSLQRNPNFGSLDNNDHGNSSSSSVSSTNGCLTEEEIRSHPAYLAYYYSNENSNPRLPPPLVSRENWRVAKRVGGGGSKIVYNGHGRGGSSSSLFAMQPRVPIQKVEAAAREPIELRKTAVRNLSRKSSTESLAGLGMPMKSGMGVRRKSFADIVQEGHGQSSASPHRLSRPPSHTSFSEIMDSADVLNTSSSADSLPKTGSYEALHPAQLGAGSSGASTKIRTSEPLSTLRSPPGFPVMRSQVPINGEENISRSNSPVLPSRKTQSSDILARLSVSKDQANEATLLQAALEMSLSNAHIQNLQQQLNKSRADNYVPPHIGFTRENGVLQDTNYLNFGRQMNLLPKRTSSSVNLRSLANSSEFSAMQDPKIKYQGSRSSNYMLNGQSQRISSSRGNSNIHSPDPQQEELLDQSTDYALQTAAALRNLSQGRNSVGTSIGFLDLQDLERIYIEALIAQQKQQFPLNYQYHGNPALGERMLHQGVQFQNERSSRFPSSKAQAGGSSGSCKTERKLSLSLLEELKNKNKSLELSDVLDHVVEFSTDQYGSRFIQQKLETATIEDKTKIFPYILPHARGLMTDVFGNYVIQKFFEHGTVSQRKELASQLLGHVLPLSLQMYGCRVIQKALEVVDLEQQTRMVAELNGSILKCVRDQNGNHVIQKCIECVPQDCVQFIISSFFGQVVALSTHPYGCRVIQRVLEHCNDPNTQEIVMDEIMKSVCTLAQDQYGNYVIQHVLQHGRPHERGTIIAKLAGQIVKMSQQKFASNVVEKCLTFGCPEERKILVNEMLGSTDENEALQAMMRDPFGNYVVQKVLETCDDQSRELIISRIKVHLNTLKRYTYGKHIVARVEKLIETGERHMGIKT